MKRLKPFVIHVPTSRTNVVAVRSTKDSAVIAHGTNFGTVIKKARKINPGETPVLLHVPQPGKTYVY